jgi:hypothetical protein
LFATRITKQSDSSIGEPSNPVFIKIQLDMESALNLKRLPEKGRSLKTLAEGEGFEPPVTQAPRQFSKLQL